MVSEISQVFNDPQAGSSPFIPQSPEVSTIRLFSQSIVDPSEWLFRHEYREKSVLKGFANVGGLWTFLAGVFAVIFGSPILRILFGEPVPKTRFLGPLISECDTGIKPFSLFGLAHSFGESEIREATLAQYPGLLKDIRNLHPDRGLLTLIYDHLIDLDFLTKDINSTSTLSEAEDTELVMLTTQPEGVENRSDQLKEVL